MITTAPKKVNIIVRFWTSIACYEVLSRSEAFVNDNDNENAK